MNNISKDDLLAIRTSLAITMQNAFENIAMRIAKEEGALFIFCLKCGTMEILRSTDDPNKGCHNCGTNSFFASENAMRHIESHS